MFQCRIAAKFAGFPLPYCSWKHVKTCFSSCPAAYANQRSIINEVYLRRRFGSFWEAQDFYRDQALRSVVVMAPHDQLPVVNNYCMRHGDVRNIILLSRGTTDRAIIEFATRNGAARLLRNCKHLDKETRITSKSRFLWLPMVGSRHKAAGRPIMAVIQEEDKSDMSTRRLQECRTISDQMTMLHDKLKMSDIDTRLRHLVAASLMFSLRGIIPSCNIFPFGSSVNGFGKHSCDLDVSLFMDGLPDDQTFNSSEGGLCFTNRLRHNDRREEQFHTELIGRLLEHVFSEFSSVVRITRARVPIVKSQLHNLDLECDICFNNKSSLYMSELLWTFGEIDPRVRPLVFTIRQWGRCQKVTRSVPGPWPSNFALTLLTMYFLQTLHQPLLPSVQELTQQTGIKYNDERPKRSVNFEKFDASSNQDSLEELLKGFFQFYADFDFEKSGLSLILASPTGKNLDAPLVIENPVEPHLNVTMNVQNRDLEKLQGSCREAITLLDSRDDTSNNWGLTRILDLGVEDKTTEEKTLLKSAGFPMSKLYSHEESENLYRDDVDSIDSDDQKGILKTAGVSISKLYNNGTSDDNSSVDTNLGENVDKNILMNGKVIQEITV